MLWIILAVEIHLLVSVTFRWFKLIARFLRALSLVVILSCCRNRRGNSCYVKVNLGNLFNEIILLSCVGHNHVHYDQRLKTQSHEYIINRSGSTNRKIMVCWRTLSTWKRFNSTTVIAEMDFLHCGTRRFFHRRTCHSLLGLCCFQIFKYLLFPVVDTAWLVFW